MPLSARLVAPTRVGRHPRHRTATAVVAAALAVVVLLAGCVSPKNQASGQVVETPTAEATGELAQYYGQQLEWTTCEQGECATAQVPLDYADPSGPSIGIALARAKATGGEPVGSLLLNRGGPGASGVDFVSQVRAWSAPTSPGSSTSSGSTPAACSVPAPSRASTGPELDELIAYDPDYSTDAGIQDVIDMYGELGAACEQNTGAVLGHVDTDLRGPRPRHPARGARRRDAHLPRLLLRHRSSVPPTPRCSPRRSAGWSSTVRSRPR